MQPAQETAVTILRSPDLTCSACRATTDRAVMVRADRATATAHFLFCHRCARRIGVRGKLLMKTNRKGT